MFNWKNIFKKRIDPKDIPVLEDIIDNVMDDVIDDVIDNSKNQNGAVEDYPHLFSNNKESTNEKLANEDDEFVIDLNDETDIDENSRDESSEDENNVVILSSVISQTDGEIDVTEIDISDINDSDLDTAEMNATEANMSEIDNIENNSEKISTKAETDDNDTDDSDTNHGEASDNNFDLNEPEQFEIIVDKVVEQLKPELELQLRSFVQKALTEKSPEEFLNSLKLDDKHTSDKD